MNKFVALLRISIKSMLKTFSLGKNKKSVFTGVGAILLIVGISLYMSFFYSHMLAISLQPVGLLDYMPMLMAVMAMMMSFAFTIFAAGGIVFGSKDNDLLLSLPVSPFFVMLSKILALYFENLLFSVFILLPAGGIYLSYGGAGGVWFIFRLLSCAFLLPFLPTLLAVILGYIITWLSTKISKKALLTNILYMVLFSLLMIFSFRINSIGELIIANAAAIDQALNGWLLPLGLMLKGIQGDIAALIGFAAIMLVPFLVVVYLFSTKYKKVLTALSGHGSRNDYRLGQLKAAGQFSALFKKELNRYFGTPIYIFNTGFGVLLLLVGSAYVIFKRQLISYYLLQMGLSAYIMPLIAVCVCGVLATACTTAVSISLEGKMLWIIKEAPVKMKNVFAAKVALNLLVSVPAAVLSIIMLAVVFSLTIADTAVLILLTMVFCLFSALMGLVINLYLPKTDADNDTLVVKQSASSMLGFFGGVFFVAAAALVYLFLLSGLIEAMAYCLLLCGLLILADFLLIRFLAVRGARMFLAL